MPDGVLLYAYLGVLSWLLAPAVEDPYRTGSLTLLGLVLTVLASLAYLIVALYGQTLGKWLLAIQVVDPQGQPPGWGQALVQEVLGKTLSALLFFLGYLMALLHPQHQALHDRVAGTYVVYRRGA